jgi:hypothetical protein
MISSMGDPVVILAPPRSFTSLICNMVGQHPEMYGLPELNLFVAETMRAREGLLSDRLFADHGLHRAVAELVAGEQTMQTIALAKRWVLARSECSWFSVFRELGARAAPKHLVDKSPRTVQHVERIQRVRRAFPEARFLHLLRHPRSQGESMWQLGSGGAARRLEDDAFDWATDPPTIDLQRVWYRAHMNILTFLDGVPEHQWIRLRGEDLLADPDLHLKKIAELVGVRTDQEAIEAMKHPERSPFACIGPLNAPFGNDPKFLRSPEFRSNGGRRSRASLDGPLPWREDGTGFTSEVVALAHEFGYT